MKISSQRPLNPHLLLTDQEPEDTLFGLTEFASENAPFVPQPTEASRSHHTA